MHQGATHITAHGQEALMPATTPHIDQGVFSRMRTGDEGALDQVFHDFYPALLQEARPLLDDAGAAARVVEHSFVDAWRARDRFETPEALETFLHESVRDGAARERKRLASIHRFEEREHITPNSIHRNGREPTADEAWRKVTDTLHAPHVGAEELAHMKHDMSRHHAAAHVAQIGKPRSVVGLVIGGVAILAVAAAGFWYLNEMSQSAELSKALARPETRILDTKPGQRGNVTLDDRTVVSLGADSRLFVPPGFPAEIRGVKIEGTGLFSPPTQERAFQLRVREATVTTTGTVFAARSYVGEPLAIVVVREGSVSIEGRDDVFSLSAGEAVGVDSLGGLHEVDASQVKDAMGWLDGRLRMTDRTLGDVIPEVRKWYAIDLRVNDPRLLERKVTIDASLESSREVIAALETAGGLKFGYSHDGTQMILGDAKLAK
jgi:ferric-dicitrate binding protein FerR (iron transport regulator)